MVDDAVDIVASMDASRLASLYASYRNTNAPQFIVDMRGNDPENFTTIFAHCFDEFDWSEPNQTEVHQSIVEKIQEYENLNEHTRLLIGAGLWYDQNVKNDRYRPVNESGEPLCDIAVICTGTLRCADLCDVHTPTGLPYLIIRQPMSLDR